MESIVIKLLDNWHWVVVLFFIGQFIKIASNAFLRVYEIRHLNKDILKLAVSNDRVELHICAVFSQVGLFSQI